MYIYIYIYIYSPGQRPNGLLDPEQQLLSSTSYQFTVTFSSICSILLGDKKRRPRNR